jgi:hypothetical protein
MTSCPPLGTLLNCSIPASYIRPDEGFAVMPWVFSAGLFVSHLLSSVCRIFLQPYDRSQLLALVLAVWAVAVTILGYQSTGFEGAKIYIWTPLMMAGDVAALIHLIKEQFPDTQQRNKMSEDHEHHQLLGRRYVDYPPQYDELQQPAKPRPKRTATDTLCTIAATLLLVASMVLQGAGLVFAIIRFLARHQSPLQTTWCSPAFQLGNQTFNADCTYFPITQYESLGIACVDVPGNQATWLGWTAIGLFILLILELSEVMVLFLPQFKTFRVRRSYRAPILTTLAGVVVWVTFIMIGFIEMKTLPPGLSETRLGIVGGLEGTCGFDASPGGLRGTIIAWSDGLFKGWSLYQ